MKKIRLVLLFHLVLMAFAGFAQTEIPSDRDTTHSWELPRELLDSQWTKLYEQGKIPWLPEITLDTQLTYLADPQGQMNLEQVRTSTQARAFRPYDPFQVKLHPEYVYWVKAYLHNPSQREFKGLITFHVRFDRIDLYQSQPEESTFLHFQTGQKVLPKYKNAILETGRNGIYLDFPANYTSEIYIRLDQRDQIGSSWKPIRQITPQLSHGVAVRDRVEQQKAVDLLFLGVFLAFAIYHLFLFYRIQEQEYLYYALLIFSYAIWISTDRYLLYEWVSGFVGYSLLGSLGMVAAIYFLFHFTDQFLDLKRNLPQYRYFLHKWLNGLWIMLIYGLLKEGWHPASWEHVAEEIEWMYSLFTWLWGAVYMLALVFVSWLLYKRKYRPATYYWFSFSLYYLFMIGLAMLHILQEASLLQANPINIFPYTHQININIGINALLLYIFSFAIGEKISRLRREKTQAIQEKLRFQENTNRLLQKKVDERTQDLRRANAALGEKNETLVELNEELTALNEEKDNLIKVVAHDLGSPLAAINLYLGLINKQEDRLSESQKDYLQTIHYSTQGLITMVRRILDVNAIETNGPRMRLEKTDVCRLIDETIKNFQGMAQRKDLELNKCYEVCPAYIQADRNYLKQVLENLISNAIKFSPLDRKISLQVVCEQEKIRIEVQDQGPGISEEDQKHLFEKYRKLGAKPTAGENSTGLGLSIVKKYTEAMKGKVWCRSKFREGATFILEFECF